MCVLLNGDRDECRHPDLAENCYVELAAAALKPNGARFSRIGEYPVD
jgi:hypothetical protein